MSGTVVVLNGTSSAGKSSIGRALQARGEGIWLLAGLDAYLELLGKPQLNELWARILGDPVRPGPAGDELIRAMYAAAAAIARSGTNVVLDHVMVTARWRQWAVTGFRDLPAWFVGVHCLVRLLDARERERGDRTLGQARRQFNVVHADCVYDHEVNTAAQSPEAAADEILQCIAGGGPRGFTAMAGAMSGSLTDEE